MAESFEKNLSSSPRKIEVLDFVRGLAIIHIILYHYYLEWFHGSFLISPEGFGKNFQNLQIFKDGGLIGLVKNLFSFLFVYGFTSVNLFLLLSGFVLTFSMLSRPATKTNWFEFIWKRLKRILIPLYISVIIGIALLYLRNILFPALSAAPIYTWIDVVKLIFPPFFLFDHRFIQLFNGDYWYIVLILQLYLLFPFLAWLLRKIGPKYFLLITFGMTVVYRFFATYNILQIHFLDSVPMGVLWPSQNSYYGFAFFGARLFEFALGMGLAHYYFHTEKFFEKLSTGKWFAGSVMITLAGFSLNYFRPGWIFSDEIVAFGLFTLFLNVGMRVARVNFLQKILKKLNQASYEIYLLHHYFLNYLLMPFLLTVGLKNEAAFWIFMPIFFVIAVGTGSLGNRLTEFVMSLNKRSTEKR